MSNLEIIEWACRLVGHEKPNTMYIAADGLLECLLFLEVDYSKVKKHENELNSKGIYYIAKYECLGFDRDILWDNR